MRPLFPVAGWVLAILLLLLAVERHMTVGRLQTRVQRLEQSADAMTAEGIAVTAQRDNVAETHARLEEAQSEVARLKARLEEALSEADEFHTRAREERPAVDTSAPEAQAAAAKPDFGAALLDALVNDPTGETAERFAQSTVQMHFGEFLQGLALTPERIDEVRAAMLEVMRDMRTHGVRGPGDTNTDRFSEEEYAQLLHDGLSELLSPEDLQLFDAYYATIEERGLRRGHAFQMDLYGQGLSQENRALISDVLVEEELALLDAQRQSTHAIPPEQALEDRLAIHDRTLERLSGTMEDRQFAILEQLLRQLENQNALVRRANDPIGESP